MRKFLTFFVIAAALFFASRTLTVAQTPTPAPASDRVWTTLEFSVCDDASATCSIKNTDTQASRRVQLYVPDTEKLEVNSTTYILQCIDVAGQNLCTSGDATVDNMLYGQDMTKTLNEAFTVMGKDPNASQACMNGYTFEGMTNATGVKLSQPLISTATGDLPEVVEWQSCYRSSMTHFLALNLVQSTTNQTTPAQLSNDGNSTTQQQESETSFTTPVPTVAPTTTSSVIGAPRRIKKEIDPYGIVFDAQTLEPVASAKITLLKKRSGNNFTKVDPYNTEDVTGGALINPYITKEDGYFTFVVKDGTYKLELAKDLNPNLSLVTKESDLDPNYTKVYSNIYPLKTGEEIIQKGKPERRDVAVLISGKKTSNPPKITSNYQELNKKTNKLSVNGRVNQPLAKIRVYSLSVDKTTNKTVRSKLVATGQADKEGYYTISINNNLFGVGEFLVKWKQKNLL